MRSRTSTPATLTAARPGTVTRVPGPSYVDSPGTLTMAHRAPWREVPIMKELRIVAPQVAASLAVSWITYASAMWLFIFILTVGD